MLTELFNRMQYEPTILMFGNNYETINKEVLSYSWNAVVTTSCELDLSARLKNDKRMVCDIFDQKNMQANLLDRRNLHVIRLFEEKVENADELEAEDIVDQALAKLKRISEIIKRNGILLLEDFEEPYFSHKEIRKGFIELFDNQKQIYIFNCKNTDKYVTSLEEKGIAVLVEESINDFFEKCFEDEDDTDSFEQNNTVQIYIESGKSAKPVSIERKMLVETDSFAKLLNIELLNEVKIPSNMYQDYFYTFLKNSTREPQWFGYSYGFNIHRNYEDRLFRKVKKGLENVGKPDNKPLLVVGQTGTGKSISLAAVAYKIFNEKKYPVIFINDPDIYFSWNVEYRKKEINRKGSPAFNALDSLLEKLEKLGATAVLLIWDTSSYSSGREKCYRLYQSLLARGRKVYLVSSAYELNDNYSEMDSDDEYIEDTIMNRKFVECKASIELSTEVEQLKDIMLNNVHMSKQEVDNLTQTYMVDKNFLSMFYRGFEMLRGDLSLGVYKEANANINDLNKLLSDGVNISEPSNNAFTMALKKIESELIEAGIVSEIKDNSSEKDEIEVAKDDFIKCIAVCAQFKIKMPYDFALRILGTYNGKIIHSLMRSTFFVITNDYYGNYEISLRTPLEAHMLISAKNMTPLDEIECIEKMLEMMNPSSGYGQQQEVRLCEKIIRIIGPNNPNNPEIKNRYKKGYATIIDALEKLRVERNIWEPILIAQEITYLREYYGRDINLENKERIAVLEKAIGIADSILKNIKYEGVSMGTRNAIIVESANSKLLLCQLKETNDTLLFKELRRDLREVIKYDNTNYHAYVTLLKGSITEYDNEEDPTRKIDLLESMVSIADEIKFENPDVETSEYFQRQVTIIYSYLKNTNRVESYVEELISNGSAAGLYVLARKQLYENDVDFKKKIEKESQIKACQKVYELFKNEKYKPVLDDSESCQYMLLNIVWLMNNKQPIVSDGECWTTQMNDSTWREILGICNNYIARFCSDAEDVRQIAKNIRYIKALCLAQLGQYTESLNELKEIKEDSTLGIKRVYTKHMICDENGLPRKFTGRLGKYDEVQRSGNIYIAEFGKNPIYFFGPRLKTTNLTEGNVFTDIEIGYSNIAPKAFRDIEGKD